MGLQNCLVMEHGALPSHRCQNSLHGNWKLVAADAGCDHAARGGGKFEIFETFPVAQLPCTPRHQKALKR